MRQGEITTTGKWTGAGGPGVTAPIPIILPNARDRFAATARRLGSIAVDHPAESWLRFVAQLASGQHEATLALASTAPLPPMCIDEAIARGVAPLGKDGCRLDPSWQSNLMHILDYLRDHALPSEARAVMEDLRRQSDDEIDEIADRFLNDLLPEQQLGHTFYVAAGLQVHYTALAARLPADLLRLLPERGLCPCCGSTPVAGVITATGRSPGCRYLHCSLCSTAWNHVRAVCVNCGEAGKLSLHHIDGQGRAKAEACDHCGTYSKLLYEEDTPGLDPVADDLSTLALDFMVAEAGWFRHAPNPLMLAS